MTPEAFAIRLARLKADLTEQARRVGTLIELALSAAFAADAVAAARVAGQDAVIDKVDVDIEKASVQLLADATKESASLAPDQLRMVLTIVKVNNELERIADAGVTAAEQASVLAGLKSRPPDAFRVMGNSVVGLLRDSARALDRLDPGLARVVLSSEDTVEMFKKRILLDSQQDLAKGKMTADQAFALVELATQIEIMAGHCTNIAEQALYVASGEVFRHSRGKWEKFTLPA